MFMHEVAVNSYMYLQVAAPLSSLSLSLSLSSFCPLSLSFSFQTGLVSSFLDNSKDIEGEQTAISIAAGDIAAIGLSLVSTCAILYT